jgi:aspartate/methionine/tyrosine aminotransferase
MMVNPEELSLAPFQRMYASFQLFSKAAAGRRNAPFLQMSAGANWLPACPSILACLHTELESALTYRNYGRPAGAVGVTTALEQVELNLNGDAYLPAVTITNGTTEAARLVFESLIASRRIRPGDSTLMVGHGFPLYHSLSQEFGLHFHEVLRETGGAFDSYLPPMDRVIQHI